MISKLQYLYLKSNKYSVILCLNLKSHNFYCVLKSPYSDKNLGVGLFYATPSGFVQATPWCIHNTNIIDFSINCTCISHLGFMAM